MATETTRLGFAARWWTYQAERFPLATHVPAIAFFFANGWLVAQALAGRPLRLGLEAGLTFAATFLTMLLLRIFDELKDFEDDRVNHPERVVQRGIVTLPELSRLGAAVVAMLVAVNIPLGWQAALAYGAVFGFALLMRVEFFAPRWLKAHIFTYALTHQGIVPLLYLYVAVAALGSFAAVPRTFGFAMAMAVGAGFCYEISRKLRAPADETETLETYTKRFGVAGASWVAFGCLAAACAAGSWLWHLLGLGPASLVAMGAALVIGAIGYCRFVVYPQHWAGQVKKDASGAVVLVNLALVVGLLFERGVVWGVR